MAKPKKTVILLWGLPGSGKSFYANSLLGDSDRYIPREQQYYKINIDQKVSQWKGKLRIPKIAEETVSGFYGNRYIILDGLITTNEGAKKFLDAIREMAPAKYDVEYKVVWWEKDIEACLHNDRGRRHIDSQQSIRHLPFEIPSPEQLCIPADCIEKQTIVRKPMSHILVEEQLDMSVNDGKLKSATWSLGGSSGDSSGSWHTPPDAQPSFKEFDELLEKICPTITFLQYKKLFAETVTTESQYHSDYYGGGERTANFICDVEKLYTLLVGMGLVKKE
jgi:hypothetical protein